VASPDQPSDELAASRPTQAITRGHDPSEADEPDDVAPIAAAVVVRRPRARGGLRGTIGPERVAAILVVLLIAVAVPVAFGVTGRVGRNPTGSPAPVTIPPPTAGPPSTSGSPSPSTSPGSPSPGTSGPAPSAFSQRDLGQINNLLTLDLRIFNDERALREELGRADGGRSSVLWDLLSEPLAHANTASLQPRPPSLGALSVQLAEAYAAIKDAARIGRDAASSNRAAQIEGSNEVIAAVGTLRELDDRMRALIGEPRGSASPAPSAS